MDSLTRWVNLLQGSVSVREASYGEMTMRNCLADMRPVTI